MGNIRHSEENVLLQKLTQALNTEPFRVYPLEGNNTHTRGRSGVHAYKHTRSHTSKGLQQKNQQFLISPMVPRSSGPVPSSSPPLPNSSTQEIKSYKKILLYICFPTRKSIQRTVSEGSRLVIIACSLSRLNNKHLYNHVNRYEGSLAPDRQKRSSCAHLPPKVKHFSSSSQSHNRPLITAAGVDVAGIQHTWDVSVLQTNRGKAFLLYHQLSHLREAADVLWLLLSHSQTMSICW